MLFWQSSALTVPNEFRKSGLSEMPLFSDNDAIGDTYTVERFLGEGAFAEVYRVRHRFLGRQAMKVFKRPVASAAEVEALLSEAILLSRIGHPNIVRVFDANIVETPKGLRGFFTMENVAGGTLDSFLHSQGSRLPVETAVDLARQVCRGLAVAHSESPPIIHRDIKPQNILVGYEATGLRVRVSDFGLAKQVNPLTLLASAAGTLAFKPPEVFENAKADSAAGDIYAIGVTLYLMLTEVFPYSLPGDFSLISSHDFDESPRRPEELNFDVDPALGDIVMRCLNRDPEKRPSDAQALLSDLEAWPPSGTTGSSASMPSSLLPVDEDMAGGGGAMVINGSAAPDDRNKALSLSKEALRMAREDARLADAADLMEEAFSIFPALRDKYSSRVKLWRAGVSM